MDNAQLQEEIKKQEQANEEFLQKVLPEVQKEFNEICKKYGVVLGANIIMDRTAIRAIPAITKLNNEQNPYTQP